jgi:subtilisin-like proprotein convertase family protein
MRFASGLLMMLTLILSLSFVAAADTGSIDLGSTATHLTLTNQSDTELSYKVEIGELATMDVSTEAGDFTRVIIPGFHSSKITGAPELPMMNRLIEIPFGANARIEVVSVQSKTIDMADYGITNQVFPAQPSMPKNVTPEDWPFIYDLDAYNTNRVANDLVTVESKGQLRGALVGLVKVSPVEYNPEAKQLVIYDEINFRVVFDDADLEAEAQLKARTSSPFFQNVYDRLDGARSPHDDHPDRVQDQVTLVVITPSMFEAQLADYIAWKTTRGFHVITGVVGTPEVGSTTSSIQSYIHDLYNNPPEGVMPPSFVVFVGDVAQCPTFFQSGDATDRPYCAVTPDLYPEIYYGRLSATNSTQLQAILDKTLMHDQFTMPDYGYMEEVVMIAGMDSGHGSTWGNGQINYGTTYYFNAAHGITSHTYLYPNSGSQSAAIVQNVSDGVSYINYTAHGSTTSWSDPSFTQSNINSLQNYGEYCLAVGNCCLTSSYDIPECFGETWLRAANKGAIGYIGGSNSTYWDEDYWFGVGSAVVTANPTYEGSGLGAYDGLFHDHGEAMTQWYVTNFAVIMAGNLAVTEGGGNETYYWNIYNLSGDPSLSIYCGPPATNPVTHPSTIFTTWSEIEIGAAPGSYVGLTREGELIGSGTVDESGALTLQITAEPLLPGQAHLVVMMQNYIPYEVDLNIIVPATVYIDPSEIDANVETELSIGVFEYDGTTPRPGVNVWAEGVEYASGVSMTGADGYCTITVNYPYGPTIDIVGQDPAEAWELFRTPLTVNAALVPLDFEVTTDIGLEDQFALNLPGTIEGDCREPDYTMFVYLNGILHGTTNTLTYEMTPDELGEVTAILAISGYDIYSESFPVIEAYGTLTGHVDDGRSPAVDAIVKGFDAGDELVFEAITDGAGNYDLGEEILVAPYTITVEHFGSLTHEQEFFLNYGANVLDVNMTPAPSGDLTGTVTEFDTGIPLVATVKVYRSDNDELFAEVNSGADGVYLVEALPYFNYRVVVKAWHHIPVNVSMDIEEPVVVKDFVLEQTIGDLLLIDDSGAALKMAEAKLDPKSGQIIAAGYEIPEQAKSSADMLLDLEDIGYTVTVESMVGTDPGTWENYDLLIACGGDNIDPFGDASFRNSLVAYVQDGGHLLIEGGEVAYDHNGDANFAEYVMHITGWNHDESGDVTTTVTGHTLLNVPNTITGPISMSYAGYGDQDAADCAGDATQVCSWSSYTSDASLIAFDPNPAPEGGQIVFYLFNYSAMDAATRIQLMNNTINYLMVQEIGDCSVSGTVTLSGESDHSGILVEAIPGGGSVYTNAAGEYSLTGLYAGPYMIRASKDYWGAQTEDIVLTEGMQMTDCDMVLTPVYYVEFDSAPGLPIPDNNAAGVSDDIDVAIGEGATVSEVEVYVNITHTFIGDLIVDLTSPAGAKASVVLHNRSGSSDDNIIGWYPSEIIPAGDLNLFGGEDTDGTWTLHISDNAGADVGVLNEWTLRIHYSQDVSAVDDDIKPVTLALFSNSPNPVNSFSGTTIRFNLPEASNAELAIFDLTGRRISTLVSGEMESGSHAAVWNGTNSVGQPVSGGIYFYRLKVEDRTLTRKMTMIR